MARGRIEFPSLPLAMGSRSDASGWPVRGLGIGDSRFRDCPEIAKLFLKLRRGGRGLSHGNVAKAFAVSVFLDWLGDIGLDLHTGRESMVALCAVGEGMVACASA
jgi:hypothetical protein